MSGRPWLVPELAKVATLYPDHTSEEIAKILGRSKNSVQWAVRSSGLRKKTRRKK